MNRQKNRPVSPVPKKGNNAFIDSQNLNLGVKKMGWNMDWRKFRIWLRDEYGVEKAYMFIGHMPEHEDMYMQMHDLGYLVVLKPTQDMTRLPLPEKEKPEIEPEKKEGDPVEEKKPIKGNIDADLVLWAMKEKDNYDKAIIVSGDGDFFGLIEYLDEQGKLLHVMAPNWQYSSLLKLYDKYIVRLDQKRRELSYRKTYNKTPKKAP